MLSREIVGEPGIDHKISEAVIFVIIHVSDVLHVWTNGTIFEFFNDSIHVYNFAEVAHTHSYSDFL